MSGKAKRRVGVIELDNSLHEFMTTWMVRELDAVA
jgi:hypothetical protein